MLSWSESRGPLQITEQDAFLTELFPEDTILGLQILDYMLVLAIQSAGKEEDEQMPGLHQKIHGNGSEVAEGSHFGTLTIH